MSGKAKTVFLVGIALLLALSIPAGVYLVRQQSSFREKASTPAGQAKVSLTPSSSSAKIGDAVPVNVSFNTAGIPVSAVAMRLTYQYSGPLPEVVASTLSISPSLLSSGDWTCPVKTVSPQSGVVNIDLNCVNTNAQGYSTSTDVGLVSFTLTANSIPSTNPLVLKFDATKSFITRKSNGEDVLLTPTSNGTFTFTNPDTTPVPTATVKPTTTPKPTATPKATATPKVTATPSGATSTPSASAEPTESPTPRPTGTLPDAGFSAPTILGVGTGVILIVGALLLAL